MEQIYHIIRENNNPKVLPFILWVIGFHTSLVNKVNYKIKVSRHFSANNNFSQMVSFANDMLCFKIYYLNKNSKNIK